LAAAPQQPKVLAPHRPVAPKLPQPKTWHDPAVPRSLVGGLWMTDGNFKSTIYLKNDVEVSRITVTPILYLGNGVQYRLTPVALEPAGTAIVDINQSLADQGVAPYATLSGYVEVQYQWPWDAICATVRNVDPIHSLIFTYNLQLPPEAHLDSPGPAATLPQANRIEGMWWKQESNVTAFVGLSNVLSAPVNVNVQVADDSGNVLHEHSVTVSPHGTKLVNLDEVQLASGSVGGISITYDGPENGLAVNGGLEDQSTGYSARLPLHLPALSSAKQNSFTYAELGLMTGEADPMMLFPAGTTFTPYSVLRNISDQTLSVEPRVYWMEASVSRSAQLQQVTIPPYRTVNLNLARLISSAGLGNFRGSINLTLDFHGKFRSLLIASGSVDQKNTYVFEVHPQAIAESVAKNLSYWSTGNGDDTMVTLWNPADEAQDFVFTLFYSGGHYRLPVHLEARATRMFNVSEVIQSQIPDADGNVIPASVREGSAEVSGAQGENEHILVAVDAGTYNVQKAICSTYCITCQGAVNSWVAANPFAVVVSGQTQLTFTTQNNNGSQSDRTSIASWSSSATSVGTVSAGLVHGANVGSLDILANDPNEPDYTHTCYGGNPDGYCPLGTGVSSQSPGTVVWVTLSLRATGTASTDDAARDQYSSSIGTYGLGTIFSTGVNTHAWRTGVEVVGTVSPSNFTGTIILQRQVDATRTYNVSTLISSAGPFSDTSDPSLRDDNPQSGGSNGIVYDLDAPSLSTGSSPINTLLRVRTNFRQWATLNGVPVSYDFLWFSRISVIKTNSGDTLATDVSSDNVAGTGSTNLSWNLQ